MRYLLTAMLGVLTLGIFYSCQKEISLEFGSGAKGTLRDTLGDCSPKTVAGSYVANKSLNDSNFIEVTVNVTAAGPYKIFTDTLNGYAFTATGTFTTTGSQTVRLKGSGTPAIDGIDDFTVFFDTSFCIISIDVLPAGSSGGAATFALANSPNACANFAPVGNYIKDTTLDSRHSVKVDVNVTTVGTYSISTNVVNGYSFSASGTFGATGTQSVTLNGNGKPLAAGTDAFTVTAGSSTCTFNITVTAVAPTGCNPTVQGTYTAGTAVAAANRVTLSHTYATAGPYNVSTNTANGYSFGPSSYTATAGANTITLNATGTPVASGTNTFTVDFGDGQNCTFTVTVAPGTTPANTDYFPTTQGSYWTYNDSLSTDTFKVAVNGTTAFSGNTYQNFNYTGFYTGSEYYRKDASNGFYYQTIDTAGLGPELTFNVPRLELNFLKNTLTTGADWRNDFTATIFGIPGTLRFYYYCENSNTSITVNGKTFTNVYEIRNELHFNIGLGFQPAGDPTYLYYARGVGLIAIEDDNGAYVQSIRNWVVN